MKDSLLGHSLQKVCFDDADWSPLTLWRHAQTAIVPGRELKIEMSDKVRARISKAAEFVTKIAGGSKTVYGINTGFGKFAERNISPEQVGTLQENLIRSHACGVGDEVSRDIVMAMWLLRLLMVGQCGEIIQV